MEIWNDEHGTLHVRYESKAEQEEHGREVESWGLVPKEDHEEFKPARMSMDRSDRAWKTW